MMADSNIIIYGTQSGQEDLRMFLDSNVSSASVITYVEVLGYYRLSTNEHKSLRHLFNKLWVLPLTNSVAEVAVALRQRHKMQLGDSLIAATALVHRKTLATHNTKDFSWIEGLALFDPLT